MSTLCEVRNRVAIVTLNRPHRMNAWTTQMERELRAHMHAADADPDVRVIVITGAEKAFCAGADMGALDGYAKGDDYGKPTEAAFAYLQQISKPVIAAVNGAAAGVGFVLMCFADLRFAAPGAKITTSFGRLGLPAEHGVSWILPRLIGAGRAADLLFSSRVIFPEEAVAMGLINRVATFDETMTYATAMANEIALESLQEMKRQLWSSDDLDAAWKHASARMVEMLQGPAFKEGVAAFREKRPPHF
jgi:enoyl-CoA hydratase/carnithine racemase